MLPREIWRLLVSAMLTFVRFMKNAILKSFDKAKAIKEQAGSEWINSEDDDILIFNVSHKVKEQLNTLSEQNNAYLITKE
jgi:hypothetical protein